MQSVKLVRPKLDPVLDAEPSKKKVCIQDISYWVVRSDVSVRQVTLLQDSKRGASNQGATHIRFEMGRAVNSLLGVAAHRQERASGLK